TCILMELNIAISANVQKKKLKLLSFGSLVSLKKGEKKKKNSTNTMECVIEEKNVKQLASVVQKSKECRCSVNVLCKEKTCEMKDSRINKKIKNDTNNNIGNSVWEKLAILCVLTAMQTRYPSAQ
ncbi:hypothetical protein RFI_09307, partial [Reticulomyxa filosa]